MIFIGMSLLHSLDGINLDHRVGKSYGQKLAVRGVGNIVSKELGIELNLMNCLLSVYIDDSQQINIGKSDHIFLHWIECEIHYLFVFLLGIMTKKYMLDLLGNSLILDIVDGNLIVTA